MNTNVILRLLQNSGFTVLGADDTYIYIEDPACILRSFETFAEYAWVIITCLTGILLFGWAISMIRGAKNDIFTNLRNLTLMFAIVAAAGPIINLVWGGDLFARGCRQVQVSVAEISKTLDARNLKLDSANQYNLYEEIDIYDSGATIASVNVDAATPSDNVSPQTGAHSVTESGRDLIYAYPDGTRMRYSGGSRAWRNNNPGNIRNSAFARRVGAIGAAGGFAVFPDEQTGMAAISELLQTNAYRNLTLAGAVSKYAPPSENNTDGYMKKIQKMTGMSINTRVADMTDAQIARVADAIRVIEGWKPGTITKE